MGNTWIVDMTHYEGIPSDMSQSPVGRIAAYFGSIVAAASASPVGVWIDAAIWCRRRPGRRPCPGHICLRRKDASGPIEWECSFCDDRGLISNWKESTWDSGGQPEPTGGMCEVVVSREELAELRKMVSLDPQSQRLLDAAVITRRGIVVRGSGEEMEELLGCIAFEANHEGNRRRRKMLDGVFERMDDLVAQHPVDDDLGVEAEDRKPAELPQGIEAFLASLEQGAGADNGPTRPAPSRGIPADVVERTWRRMAAMPVSNAGALMDDMRKAQPNVLAYLLAVDHDILNQDERELLLYLGVVVWQIMSQGLRRLPRVTQKALDEAEARNIEMLEHLEKRSEAGFLEAARRMVNSYGQPEVLRFVIEALMEEPEEGCPIRDVNTGIMMLDLKTVMDCLDALPGIHAK